MGLYARQCNLLKVWASITSSATLDKYDVGQKRLKTTGLKHQRTVTISPDGRKWPTL
jgi:hypothetical protein